MSDKNLKKYLVPIMSISIFAILVFGAGFAYFTATLSMNTSNYQVTLPSQTSLICTKTDCNVTITPAMMTEGNVSSTTPKGNSNCSLTCTCSGSQGATCVYNVSVFEVGTPYVPSPTLGDNKEFTVTTNTGTCETKNSSTTESRVDVIKNKVVAKCTLTVPQSGSVSKTVSAEFKWYNLNLDQTSHSSLSYEYYLTTEDAPPSYYNGNIYQNELITYYQIGDDITQRDLDYSEVISTTDYIKYDVVNNIVTAAYTCIYDNNQEFCVQGGNSSYFGSYTNMSSTSVSSITGATGNIRQIQLAQEALSGTATYSSSEARVNVGSLRLKAYPDGSTESCWGVHCQVISSSGYCRFDD